MKKAILASIVFCICIALIAPIALSSRCWKVAIFIALVSAVVYIYTYFHKKNILPAFLTSLLFGIFFSLIFWLLFRIDHILHLQSNLYFVGTFFIVFSLISFWIMKSPESPSKKIICTICNLAAITAFILLVTFISSWDSLLHAIVMGKLIGIVTASISTYIFVFFHSVGSRMFNDLVDYIAILRKPFLIFFTGYILIALVYAGVYNLIYMYHPESFSIPENQVEFLDFIIYSLDTMTTGGNSQVNSITSLAQAINTANVFSAIVWMTVMLAATIAYTSEAFSQVSKKHKEQRGEA